MESPSAVAAAVTFVTRFSFRFASRSAKLRRSGSKA